jgi:hypothetical protein
MLLSLLLYVASFSLQHTPPVHDFHVSKCLIEYRPDEQALQISLHLFIDDLEYALEQRGQKDLYICTAREKESADKIIAAYLARKLSLEVNNRKHAFEFIGKEVSDDLSGIWCYLEITNIKELKALSIHNSILLEIFDDQKNIVSLTGPNQRGTLLLQKGNDTEAFRL